MLLNADGVANVADIQPLGWRRSAARAAVRPFQAVSHGLYLNRPRLWLAEAVGAPTLAGAGHDPEPAPPTTTVPGVSTTVPAPIVVRTPTATDPLQVYLAGDSFLADVARGLSATVGRDDGWDISTDAKPGTGLSRPEVIDWPKRVAHRLPNDTEVVVLGFGGNDAQDILSDGHQVKVGEPAWEAEYRARIAHLLEVVDRPGRTIVWVGMPVATVKNIEKGRPAMTRAARAELARHAGTLFLDSAATLSGGDGQYKDLLTIDGEPKRVRAPDGFHLTPAGATLLGRALVRLVATVWPVKPSDEDPGVPSTTSATAVARPTSSTGRPKG